jgi:hypothetical protein
MKQTHGRILTTAERVRDLGQAQSYANQRYIEALNQLSAGIGRARDLETQRRNGATTVRAARTGRKEQRDRILDEFVTPITRIAASAASDQPELTVRFRPVRREAGHRTFLGAVLAIIKEATTHQALFVSYGMPESFVADLTAALAAYEQLGNEMNAGIAARVGAVAELGAVVDEIMALIQQLDAMQRYRFRDDPEQLAAWESARNIAWPLTSPAKAKAKPGAPSKDPAA